MMPSFLNINLSCVEFSIMIQLRLCLFLIILLALKPEVGFSKTVLCCYIRKR